jgi:predicted O-methyltransferase YrrM
MSRLSALVKYSVLGRLAAFPMRMQIGFRPLFAQTGLVFRWLVNSREWANFSCDYTPEGLAAAVAAISELTGRSREEIRGYADELKADSVFAARYKDRVTGTRLRWVSDPTLRYGKCMVNYMLVRATDAKLIFEAGTERGLSTLAMCRALQRNDSLSGAGRIVTVDIGADRGGFLAGDEGGLVQCLNGDSVAALKSSGDLIDLFLHDTVNDPLHTREQFKALSTRLAVGGFVHTSWFTSEFLEFCDSEGLRCIEYAERVSGHWYAGRRAGFAVKVEKIYD